MIQRNILVSGIVQGVGFRPTVYRIATDLNLNGSIRNLGNIVEIILEGNESGKLPMEQKNYLGDGNEINLGNNKGNSGGLSASYKKRNQKNNNTDGINIKKINY